MGKFYLEMGVGGREIGKWKMENGKGGRRRTDDYLVWLQKADSSLRSE
jgi:hypothetical protein